MAWLYKRPDSAKWWIGYMANGKQFLRSTKTTDKKTAEAELARVESLFRANDGGMLEAVYQALSGKTVPKITLKAALGEWKAEVQRSCGDAGTLHRYKDIAEEFCKFIGATDDKPLITDIGTEHCRAYLNQRRLKCTASTTNLERKVLSVFFRRAMANEQLKTNPILPVKPFKAGKGESPKRRAFSVAELQLLYSKAPNDFWKYMIVGGTYTGLRLSDLVCLAWESVDFKANVIHATTRKTNTVVHIPIAAPLRIILDETHRKRKKPSRGHIWPEQAAAYEAKGSGQFSNEFYDLVLAPCGFVPVRSTKHKQKAGRDATRNVNPVSFHSFRHSFVSLLKAAGGNQAVAKELAGHSSDLISDNYTHIPPEVLAKAIAALPEVTK
jgi:integrase